MDGFVAAGAIGIMKDCMNESVSHAKTRVQHSSLFATKQLIQRHIAKIILNIEKSRWLIYRAAFVRQKTPKLYRRFKDER